MGQELLKKKKLGWKTSYYQNTYDSKSDIDEPAHPVGWKDNVEVTEPTTLAVEEDCDSCTI